MQAHEHGTLLLEIVHSVDCKVIRFLPAQFMGLQPGR